MLARQIEVLQEREYKALEEQVAVRDEKIRTLKADKSQMKTKNKEETAAILNMLTKIHEEKVQMEEKNKEEMAAILNVLTKIHAEKSEMEKDKARTEEISNTLKKVQAEKLEMEKQRKSEAEANLATLEKIRSEKAELQRQNREASDRIQAASGVIKHGKELRAGLHSSLRMVNVKALAALVVVKNLWEHYVLLYEIAETTLSITHQLEDRNIQYEKYIKEGQEWEKDTREKIEEDRQFYIREIGRAQAAYDEVVTQLRERSS